MADREFRIGSPLTARELEMKRAAEKVFGGISVISDFAGRDAAAALRHRRHVREEGRPQEKPR